MIELLQKLMETKLGHRGLVSYFIFNNMKIRKTLVSCSTNSLFQYDIGEIAFGWLCVKIFAVDWLLREVFDVTCNFRHVTSKKKRLLTLLVMFKRFFSLMKKRGPSPITKST